MFLGCNFSLSSLKYSSLTAWDQGKCAEKICSSAGHTFISLLELLRQILRCPSPLSVIGLLWRQKHLFQFSRNVCSVLTSFYVQWHRKRWLLVWLLQLHVGGLPKVLSQCPKPSWCLLVDVVSLLYFKTFILQAGTDCTGESSFKMLPL